MFRGQLIDKKTGNVVYQSQPLPEFYLAYGVTEVELKTKYDNDSKKYRLKVLDSNRLFSGLYPCGVVYADRNHEEHGDYKRLAFLSYSTLVLDIEKDCPEDLKQEIITDAKKIQEKKGQSFSIAGNMSVILGSKV